MKQSLIKFPNGLRVMFCSKPSAIVTISFSLCFGAEQEKNGINGISHFIECLLKNALTKIVSKVGGVVETATDYEHIEITISTVREKLEFCFSALTGVLFDFHPKFETFDREKTKILQEIENYKANPLTILNENTQKARYKGTALATDVLGNSKSINNITLNSLRSYYNSIFVPEYILLSIVGNISDEIVEQKKQVENDENYNQEEKKQTSGNTWNNVSEKIDVRKIVDKKYNQDSLEYIKNLVVKEYYSKTINLPRKTKHHSTKYCALSKNIVIEKQKNLNQSRIQISIPSAPYNTSGYRYAKLISNYLRGYLISNLSGVKGLYSLDVSLNQFKNNAHLSITVAVDYEKASDVYYKIIKLLSDLKEQTISVSEFESLKVAHETIVAIRNERASDLAKRFNKWLYLTNEQYSLNREIKSIRALDFDNFQYILKEMLNFDQMVVVYLGKKLEEGLKGYK